MANLYKEREQGDEARRILASPVWAGAWDAYRARILEEIEQAASANVELVMHLKRLLSAGTAARAHLERIMREGEFAARSIEFDERKKAAAIGEFRPAHHKIPG